MKNLDWIKLKMAAYQPLSTLTWPIFGKLWYMARPLPYMARIVHYFFFFVEPVFGRVRTIHRCVQYIDFAEICHPKF